MDSVAGKTKTTISVGVQTKIKKTGVESMSESMMKLWLLKKDKPDAMGITFHNYEKILIVSIFPIVLGIMYLVSGGMK